jgi:ubiquinone/menaquinone biosynthesis C-methylase UbiE
MEPRKLRFEPVIQVDFSRLIKLGLNKKDILDFIPKFILNPTFYCCSKTRELATRAVLIAMRAGIRILLNPRRGKVGDLGPDEVEDVYNREAESYDTKHHLTTCGQDLIWRRHAASCVVNYVLQNGGLGKILDLCTGTGLTTKEIDKAFGAWEQKGEVTALDYNEKMLSVSRRNLSEAKNINISLVRGDATSLVAEKTGFKHFSNQEFDVVTQMFGIGGISKPLIVAEEVLKVLKNGGQYFLADMHSPIQDFFGEWPFLFKWFRLPLFEALCYEIITMPLALERLWGWRDTTALFYLFRLINIKDEKDGKYYGFKVVSYQFIPDRWWFSLPIMPIANTIFQKTEISEAEALRRRNLLSVCIY